jgi:hypothetical protein
MGYKSFEELEVYKASREFRKTKGRFQLKYPLSYPINKSTQLSNQPHQPNQLINDI